MSQRTKKRQKQKQLRKRQKRARQLTRDSPGQPVTASYKAPKINFYKMPDILPADLPLNKRLELVKRLGAHAKDNFNKLYPQISKWFNDYDPLYLLSFCVTYFLSHPEGVDPEVTGQLEFYPFYIEIMQAFSLYNERTLSPKPLLDDAQKLKQEMMDIGEAMQFRLLDIPPNLTTDEDFHAYYLRTQMMQQTTAVRNWAYHHQIKRIALSLADAIKNEFIIIYGVSPVDLIHLLFKLMAERNDLLNEHLIKLRKSRIAGGYKEIITAYNAAFPENVPIEGEAIEVIWDMAGKNKRNLFSLLVYHADLKLDHIYSFTLEHARSLINNSATSDALSHLLDRLSFQFGDLKEFDKEHIILNNPVLSRPFIRINESTYYSAVWGVIPHIALDLLEDLVWGNEPLRNAYTAAKSSFLELEVEGLCRRAFPNALVYRGSQWADKQTGKIYENDLTVFLDSFALVIESKSGTVSDPARRGAPKRLFETLKALIEEPSEQAHRFISHLKQNHGALSYATKHGTVNVIDASNIKYYIPLGVTLSQLGFIGSNLQNLVNAKVVDKRLEDLAPSISVTDLEVIFELLTYESQIIHYLARRREFEAHMKYQGDELDLLGFYLENGFNIGDTEYNGKLAIHLGLKSKELDPYFVGTSEGQCVVKPELRMTKWWKDLLQTISDRKMEGWIETSYILLNMTREDQEDFERKFRQLMLRIKTGKTDKLHNWIVFGSGPQRRRYLIAGYPYTTSDREVRNRIMNTIVSDENYGNARGCVVIGVQMESREYPYSVLARRASSDLFDTLTLDKGVTQK